MANLQHKERIMVGIGKSQGEKYFWSLAALIAPLLEGKIGAAPNIELWLALTGSSSSSSKRVLSVETSCSPAFRLKAGESYPLPNSASKVFSRRHYSLAFSNNGLRSCIQSLLLAICVPALLYEHKSDSGLPIKQSE